VWAEYIYEKEGVEVLRLEGMMEKIDLEVNNRVMMRS